MKKQIIVVFHDPASDKAGTLNHYLRRKNACVDSGNRVAAVQFPDGWLIVCYDDAPDEKTKQILIDKITDFQPERIVTCVHLTTWILNPLVKRAQSQLMTHVNGLASEHLLLQYSHEPGDNVYDGLIKILSHSTLGDLTGPLDSRTLISDFSRLKHRLGHVFSPIDIDLQGLAEAGFNADYVREVVAAYEARNQQGTQRTLAASQGTPSGTSVAHGKAVASLAAAREIAYGNAPSIKSIVEESLQSSAEGDIRREVVKSVWQVVIELLPENDDLPQDVLTILRCIESEEGLRQLKARFEGEDPYNNAFHQWWNSLNETLEQLRRVLILNYEESKK